MLSQMSLTNGTRRLLVRDVGLSNPYQKHEWIVSHIRKVFGKDSVEFAASNFGFTLYLAITKVGSDGKRKRTTLLVRKLSCLHRFKLLGEAGYGTECEDHPKLHRTWDIEQEADKVGRHKFLDLTIDGLKKEFEKMEVE